MKINNIFLIHNWEINKLLSVVLLLQITILGLSGMDLLGFQIPILRPIIGFIYLTFIPGALILRNLKIKDISSIESILYTVGLSLASLMFTGFFINTIYPFFGVSKPLSFSSTLLTISVIVILLSILAYFRDDGSYEKEYLQIENIKFTLFLILIPFLAVIGTYLFNFYGINLLIIILIVIISLISILGLSKFFNISLYPLTIFVVSLALLYHNSLISMHIWGWDINAEYYLASLVLKNGFWNSHVTFNSNSMLSIVMLAPIYSYICKLSLTWVFKIIYPFLFSMVPLGLYFITKKYTNPKIAFLSTLYFMFVYMFFCDMLQLARQEIAEFFFVMIVLLVVSTKIEKIKRSLLFIIFGFSLIVSHYGLSYIAMFYMVLTALITYVIGKKDIKISKLDLTNMKKKWFERAVTLNFALLFVVLGISWYIYTSNASPFVTIVGLFNHISSSILTDFLNPNTVQGLSIVTNTETLPFHQFNKILYLISQLLIFLGLLCALLINKTRFSFEYKFISFLSFSVAIFALVLPYFASALQTSRIFQITLLILSPFFVLGILAVFNLIKKVTKIKFKKEQGLKFTAIFLSIFVLFNSGLVYEVTGEIEPSMSLMSLNKNFDYALFDQQEVYSAYWLTNHKTNLTVYGDVYRNLLLNGFLGNEVDRKEFKKDQNVTNSLLYFGTFNINKNEIAINSFDKSSFGTIKYVKIENLSNYNKIYDSNGSMIYLAN